MLRSRNSMLGTIALGAAAYLLRNKESREKLMGQFKNLTKSGNVDKNKHKTTF